MTGPEPYRQATPQRVIAFLCGLAWLAGRPDAFEAHLSQLTTMLAVPRAPGAEERR